MNDAGRQDRAFRHRFESTVRQFANDHALFPETSRVLVAVSGGPDSTALLLVLSRLAESLGLGLAVAHFDHGLRGLEVAEREASYVKDLALARGLPFYAGSADVRSSAEAEKRSLEDAARVARYAFLAEAARESECPIVATGHTASDQAETVLQHIIRGTGLDGLSGVAPRSVWPFAARDALTLVRPLLRLAHADTAAYCAAHGVQPIEDESNASLEYQRNRVRHQLMPALRQYNPRVEDALVRLADAAREDVAYLDAVASRAVEVIEGRAYLPRTTAAALPAALRRRSLRLAITRLLGDVQGFSERHYLALDRLALVGRTGDHLDLPRSLVAELTRESLEVGPPRWTPVCLPNAAVSLCVPGEARFGGLRLCASSRLQTEASWTSAELDAEAVGAELMVRSRTPGDRFQPLGMTSTKKLQDFFVDAHVPRRERDAIPLFENAGGILWVGGLRIAEWARPRAGKPTVFLSFASC